jgi:hypothetical protein
VARKPNGTTTQKDMVEAALNEAGWGAKPQDLQPVIKEKFNTDLTTQVISNYKSKLKSESGKGGKPKGGKPGRKPGRKAGPQFEDLQAVRGLVDKLGAEQVKKLVDVATMFA